MKSKHINWRDNSILYAEHMRKFNDLITESNGYNLKTIFKYNYGVIKINIDEVALNSGILSINYVHGIMQDGEIFEYDSSKDDYELTFNLQNISEEIMYVPKSFYLTFDNQFIEENQEIISKSEEIIPISYEFNKLKITDEFNGSIGFPIAEVFIKGGAFVLKDFYPACLSVNKNSNLGKEINHLILFLRQTILSIREQNLLEEDYENIIFNMNLHECLIKLNIDFINENHPYNVYQTLGECVAILAWKNILIPNLPVYHHEKSYEIIKKISNIISEIILSSRGGYQRKIFEKEDNNVYSVNMPDFGHEDVLLIIEPNNQNIKEWVENTIICSRSFFEDCKIKRFPGIGREIIDESSTEIVIKLDKYSNYLINKESLMILGDNSLKVNSIFFYYKNTN